MKAEEFIINFPDGLPAPPLFVKLAAYYGQPSGFLPGELELTKTGRRDAIAWFGKNEVAAHPFVIFARDGTDSLFGYWRDQDQSLDQAPLVFLHDEGVESTVLTNTLEEFLALLALGNPAHTIDMVEGEDEPEDDEYAQRYRAWLRAETDIAVPTIAEAHAIVERARVAHPSLDEWLNQAANARTA